MKNETSERKLDHIEVCLEEDVESRYKTTGFEEIELLPKTSPEIGLDEINTETSLFGKKLDYPIIISPMTGGHEKGGEINRTLAKAAQELNIGIGVGSQRAGIEKSELRKTYQVRDVAPDVLLFGNLGAVQFAQNYGVEEAKEAIEMIDADALGIHFNPLQESIQPNGDTDFRNTLENISKIIPEVEKPVYAKETGGGMSGGFAKRLVKMGAEAIDVSGAGGTSWAGVEALREESRTSLGEVFWDWGLPTAVSTADVSSRVDVPVIASGGIRTGLDAAKALALGADLVGIALPLFRASVRGKEEVVSWLEEFIEEFKTAMFLTGCETPPELYNSSIYVSDLLREWFKARDLDTDNIDK